MFFIFKILEWGIISVNSHKMEILNNSDSNENETTPFLNVTKSNSDLKSENGFLEDGKVDSFNSVNSFELKNWKDSKKYVNKIKKIRSISLKKPVNIQKLRKLAVSEGGLIDDEIRKTVWLQLLEITDVEVPKFTDEEKLQNHPEYHQVVLDVNRSLRRFPPGIPLDQRLALQNQLTFLILRVVTAHPRLRYYQGYHDVAVTLLLVTGLEAAYCILEKLSVNHLKDCMEPTMEKTSHLLNYIYPLIRHQNNEVYEYLEKSGVGTMFALPWFLTWFGHSLNQYQDVVRLFDYFLATEPLTPLYLSSVIIVFRSKEILETPCDMANLHSLLSQIPDDLPFETLLVKTTELYKKHPPDKIQKEALARTQQEEEQRKKDFALRRYRMNRNLPFLWHIVGRFDPNRRLPIWAFMRPNGVAHNFSRYIYLVAATTFAVGFCAIYLKK